VSRTALATAIDNVAARDPVLAHLVALVGPIKHRPRDPDGHFGALVRSTPYRSVVARYCWEAVALFRGGTDPGLR
jgi:hypothetical protein